MLIVILVLPSLLLPSAIPSEGLFNSWYGNVVSIDNYSWDSLLKIGFIYTFPFIIAAILISWIIHGVGFVIIKR